MVSASPKILAAVITCSPSNNPCNGTEGDDIMKGDNNPNDIFGLGGNDRISAGGGFAADELLGGVGDDILMGQKDPDVLQGEIGNDKLIGGGDRDVFDGGPGADSFDCGPGDNDWIIDFNPSEGDTKSNDCELF